MPLYVAAYDIADPAARRSVARVLKRYGPRVQRSVFEVRVEADDLAELRRRVGRHLSRTDEFDLFPVDERAARRRTRWAKPPHAWAAVVEC